MFNSAAATLNDIPKGGWIAIMVLSFIFFWPLGLVVLFYLIGSGKMHAWKQEHWAHRGYRHGFGCRTRWHTYQSSGNSAFDAYRDETLKRLEEEQKAFSEFLDRLRKAKDKAEFDQFMAERKAQSDGPAAPPST
jgi:hypothetical protein